MDTYAVGQRVVIGGDGKGSWAPYTGRTGEIREIKDDPSCRWPYSVLTDSGVWLYLMREEMEAVE